MPTRLNQFKRPVRRRQAFYVNQLHQLLFANPITGSLFPRRLGHSKKLSTHRNMPPSPPAADGKRKADRPISPPPVKRKAQSSISSTLSVAVRARGNIMLPPLS